MSTLASKSRIGVIGAGVMGAGIAQVAASHGHLVDLHDARPGGAAQARDRIASALERLVERGRIDGAQANATLSRIVVVNEISELAGSNLVIEAIHEDLDAKRAALSAVAAIVGSEAILASNTSSLSITALAAAVERPQRVVGLHFFNPVPAMRLVEVVSGVQTDPGVVAYLCGLVRDWGKVPARARSTPGFIVNRVARPYYGEAWALLQDQHARADQIDLCLRGAGFRMGPFELMDLVGHDVNNAVTTTVYRACFEDPRYRPSLRQVEMVAAGFLGRKSGQGVYRYPDGLHVPADVPKAFVSPDRSGGAPVVVHGRGAVAERFVDVLTVAGIALSRHEESGWVGLAHGDAHLVLSDGRSATQVAAESGVQELVVFDFPAAEGSRLAFAAAARASDRWVSAASTWLTALSNEPERIGDAPGLVVTRTLAMLVNEAFDLVQQGICTEGDVDQAMVLGMNHPRGPFAWAELLGAEALVRVLDHLDAHYRGSRYRASCSLRARAWAGSARH